MKLTILGASAAWSERLCRPSSCYMLEIGDKALREIFQMLNKNRWGDHATSARGSGRRSGAWCCR